MKPGIVFFGTPSFAVASLEAILSAGYPVPLVVTQPDREAGRGLKSKTQAVKAFCLERNLPLLQPPKMKDPAFHQKLRDTGAAWFVVAAFGRILPRAILDLPKLTLNVHASLLPRWRGASPIQRAVVAGDAETGISIIRLVEELDAGDVLLKKATLIDPNETSGELEQRLARIGGEAIVETLRLLESNQAVFAPQPRDGITLAPPIDVSEAQLSWALSAAEIHNRIRGFQPWPGAFTHDGTSRMKLLRSRLTDRPCSGTPPGQLLLERKAIFVATGDVWLELLELQREGRGVQTAQQFAQGYRGSPQWH